MSAAFTSVGSGATYEPRQIDIVNELIGAWSERRQSVGDAAVGDEVAGNDAHDLNAYWKTMQDWIEGNYTDYVDHTQAVSGGFGGQVDIPVFTLASFRALAGLNANGFRRATEWTPHPTVPDWETDISFSYGTAQAGDIPGPWIYDDLQKAFSALKWSLHTLSVSVLWRSGRVYIGEGVTSCSAAVAIMDAEWAVDPWGPRETGEPTKSYSAVAWLLKSGSDWLAVSMRSKCLPSLAVAAARPCEIQCYFKMQCQHNPPYETFEDIDGLGVTEDTLYLHETWPEIDPPVANRGGAGEATWLGAYNTSPFHDAGFACPTQEYKGIDTGYERAVVKWNFTNSN